MRKATTVKQPSSHLVGARTGDLEPLVALWIKKNPRVAPSNLVRAALRESSALRKLAGKRYAHLVANN